MRPKPYMPLQQHDEPDMEYNDRLWEYYVKLQEYEEEQDREFDRQRDESLFFDNNGEFIP